MTHENALKKQSTDKIVFDCIVSKAVQASSSAQELAMCLCLCGRHWPSTMLTANYIYTKSFFINSCFFSFFTCASDALCPRFLLFCRNKKISNLNAIFNFCKINLFFFQNASRQKRWDSKLISPANFLFSSWTPPHPLYYHSLQKQ